MRRTAAEVDVPSVGRGRRSRRLEPQAAEQRRRHRRRGAVGAVDGERERRKRGRCAEARREVMRDTRSTRSARAIGTRRRRPSPPMTGRRRWPRLPARLVLGELLAASGEHFDAVVFERIVRRRNHDAERRSPDARVRYATAGVGTTPTLVTRAPSPDAPCASSRFDPVTGLARVAADEQPRRAAPCGSARTSAAPSRATVAGSSGDSPATPARRPCQTDGASISTAATGPAAIWMIGRVENLDHARSPIADPSRRKRWHR